MVKVNYLVRVMSMIRFRCSIRNTGVTGLQLDFRYISDVRVNARSNFKFKLKWG